MALLGVDPRVLGKLEKSSFPAKTLQKSVLGWVSLTQPRLNLSHLVGTGRPEPVLHAPNLLGFDAFGVTKSYGDFSGPL